MAETQLGQFILHISGVSSVGLAAAVESLGGHEGGFQLGGVTRRLVLAVHWSNISGGLLLDCDWLA